MSLSRRKTDSLNNKPFDRNASPEQKAREFDQQYGQNRKYTNTPNADAAGVPKRKGKHSK
ncbi:MAG TPA: hypothetical protein VIY48_10715 [Candidatus Paceibacterota bacterium]